MFKKILIFSSLISSVFAGTINIAVAANVSYASEDLIKEFTKQNPNIKVKLTLASSGKLTAQIKNNAPYDIFMSANMKYPKVLYEEGLSLTKPLVYAQGKLSLFSIKKQNFKKDLALLKDESIKKIALANPKTAPYGKAALEVFENAEIYENIKEKLVYAQSISQTLSYAISSVDIALIAKSSLYAKTMLKYKENINYKDIDTKLYSPIKQGIIITSYGKNNKEAKIFYDFILSKEAKEIFKAYGYLVDE